MINYLCIIKKKKVGQIVYCLFSFRTFLWVPAINLRTALMC